MEMYDQIFNLSVTFCQALERLKEVRFNDKAGKEALQATIDTCDGLMDSLEECIPRWDNLRRMTDTLKKLCGEMEICQQEKKATKTYKEYADETIELFNDFVFAPALAKVDLNGAAEFNEDVKRLAYLFSPVVRPILRAMAGILYSRAIAETQPKIAYDLVCDAFQLAPELGNMLDPENLKGYTYGEIAEKNRKKCPSCGGKGMPHYCAHLFLSEYFEEIFAPAKLWMRCPDCGLIYAWNHPKAIFAKQDTEELLLGGSELYSPEQQQTADCSDILQELEKHVTFAGGSKRLLDVECGTGDMAAAAQQRGYEVTAIEANMNQGNHISALLGFPVLTGTYPEHSFDEPFDIIVLGDALAFTENPKAILEKAGKELAEGGVIFISTPVYETDHAQRDEFADPVWMDGYRQMYFSKESLDTLLVEEGFRELDAEIVVPYAGFMGVGAVKC